MKQITCPAEGCDYHKPVKSVFAHYLGSRGDRHSGGQAGFVRSLLESEQDIEQDQEQDMEQTSEQDQEQTGEQTVGQDMDQEQDMEQDVEQDTENPTFGNAEPGQQTTDAKPQSEPMSKKEELPCGCESIYPSQLPDRAIKVTCDECGESYRWLPDE